MNIRDWLAYLWILGTQMSIWMTLKMSVFGLNEALVKATTDPYQVFATNLLGYLMSAYIWGWKLAFGGKKELKDSDGN